MRKSKSFWTTLPGILTAIATLIGAVSGFLIALHTLGWRTWQSQVDPNSNGTSCDNIITGINSVPC